MKQEKKVHIPTQDPLELDTRMLKIIIPGILAVFIANGSTRNATIGLIHIGIFMGPLIKIFSIQAVLAYQQQHAIIFILGC